MTAGKEMLIGGWLEHWRAHQPLREALYDSAADRRISYGELANAVDLQLGRLIAAGIGAGDRVALLQFNRPETLTLLFACARLGCVLVPLNYRLTAAELTPILADAEPVLLLHDLPCQALAQALTLPEGCSVEPLDAWLARPSVAGPAPPSPDPEAPLLMLYTSGTTGRPKGVLQSQRMICWNAINTAISWDLSGADCALVHTPFFHTGGLHVLTTPLLQRGGRLVLLQSFDPESALRLIAEQRVTVLFAVPTMFQMLQQHADFAATDFSSLRFCISGGAPCPIPLIASYQARGVVFKQGYGLTEAGPNCFTLQQQDAVRKIGSVGKPNCYTEARVVDADGQTVADENVGELWLAGPTLCSGYWRNPEATQQLFAGEWLKTGDLVRIDGQGYCYVVDRKKDMYISGGENVYPAEIEAVLLQHPAVAEAAVIGIAHPKWGEVGEAHVLLNAGADCSAQQLLSFAAERLARYKLPQQVVFRQLPLPRTPTGKVRKNQLRS